MTRHSLFTGALALLLAVAGCKAATLPLADTAAGSIAAAPAAVAPVGAAKVRVRFASAAGRRVLGLPAAWDSAVLNVYSPGASTGYDQAHHRRVVAADDFTREYGPSITYVEDVLSVDHKVRGIAVSGSKLFAVYDGVSQSDRGVVEVDMANNNASRILLSNLRAPKDVEASGSTLYLANEGTVYKGDVGGGSLTMTAIKDIDWLVNMKLASSTMYVATDTGRVAAFDVGNPSAGSRFNEVFSSPFGLAFADGKLYVADSDYGGVYEAIFDSVDFPPAWLEGLNSPTDLETDGQYLYVIEAGGAVKVYDLATKALIDSESFPFAYGLALTEDALYVSSETNKKVSKFARNQNEASVSAEFPPLRPAEDYQVAAYLRRGGELVGTAYQSAQTLLAGANVVDLVVTSNAEAGLAGIQGGNTITKGATVTVKTGIAASLPGVEGVRVYLSGPCYGAGRVQLGDLTDGAAWQGTSWNTGASASPYDHLLIQGGGATGTIDIETYNSHGETVGATAFEIIVND